MTEGQKRSKAEYDKRTASPVYLKLNKKTDADILERLDSVDNKQGYIKKLIREDIASEQANQ